MSCTFISWLKKNSSRHLKQSNGASIFFCILWGIFMIHVQWQIIWITNMMYKGNYMNIQEQFTQIWICQNVSGHPRCRWVCFFIRTDLEKFSITSLAHQWILCSEWVLSERKLIKASQLARNPHIAGHQLTSCKVKSCVFLRIKSVKIFYISKPCFRLKYESSIHNIAFSIEKSQKMFLFVGGFWCEREIGDGLFHLEKHYYGLWTGILARSNVLKLNLTLTMN